MVADYATFLASKTRPPAKEGREVTLSQVKRILHPWQKLIVRWAVRTARAAIWADTGMGKTLMQIEWARIVAPEQYRLIVAPLAVCEQTIEEARDKLNVTIRYATSSAEVTTPGIYITNYERVHNFDPSTFSAVVLDEASILKNHEGAMRSMLIEHFRDVPNRLACTATPAPNDPQELTNQAAFLGRATRPEMLAAYFIHDSDGWRLKRHARTPMFEWLASWAVAVRKPSDLGPKYSDDGYVLPRLRIIPHTVMTDTTADMLRGVTGRAAVRKATMPERIAHAVELRMAEPDEPWLMWAGLNDEANRLAAMIPGAVNVEGSWTAEAKANALLAFSRGEIRTLITKPKIAAFGMNWQSCARMTFVGLNDSYEQYYQGIRRCWRYGQTREVHAHIVLSEAEAVVAENVKGKQDESSAMVADLVAAMNRRKLT